MRNPERTPSPSIRKQVSLSMIFTLVRKQHVSEFECWSYFLMIVFAGTGARSYADGSFTQYLFHLHKFTYDPQETKIHMQIRTRDPDGGVLMFNAGSEEGRFSSLEVLEVHV